MKGCVRISRFKELAKNKSNVLMRIIKNQNLCKAIYYTDRNFLDQPDISDPSSLIYSQIYPYNRIPDAITEGKTFLTFSFSKYKSIDRYFKEGYLNINIMVHKKNMETDYGVLRPDYILAEIDSMMDTGFGIGKLQLNLYDEFNVNADYLGSYVSYNIVEFR